MKRFVCCAMIIAFYGIGMNDGFADNPLILDQFSADPTARVFEGKIYVYPSHDIPAAPGRGRAGWFVMEDYHVFSSGNLMDWTDHGVILNQTDVPWLERKSFDMWAPDCVFKDGKYYFYFPASGRIGVAVADKPEGPYKPADKPINGVRGIDPCVFIDNDGKAYLYYSMNRIFAARLKDNMLELDSEPLVIGNLPQKGLIEGPFVFERNGIYYLTYPHVQNKTERLEYAISTSPMGPFEHKGVIMDESPSGCWTNHHSIVEYKGQWYLFYHDKDLSPDFDKNRAIRADYLSFNEDGTIRKVTPTLRGVGIADALKEIQIDRYSAVSPDGVTVDFVDSNQKQKGWKAVLAAQNAWVQYNNVDFGEHKWISVRIKAASQIGGVIEIRMDNVDGPLTAKVEIPENRDWSVVKSGLLISPSGVRNLVVKLDDAKNVEIDWIQFE
ncbi:MAG: family 43 glycosylhydrolase [Sedimentisphaerales bacterium]|nr:family 43 glycosylhydrolase [Sedimentisphaerales bacterium]